MDAQADLSLGWVHMPFCWVCHEAAQSLYVPSLIPRGGTNMKPFNEILKDLCDNENATFIDKHDSFIMTSGERPFCSYETGKVTLKFPGIRTLVHNMYDSCPLLPKKAKSPNSGS